MKQNRNITLIIFFAIALLVSTPIKTKAVLKKADHEAETNARQNTTWSVRPLPGVNGSIKSIAQADDGGFVFAGYKEINDGKCENKGGCNKTLYIFKLDPAGNKTWEFSYGNSHIETCESATQTLDGGFIAACKTKTECASNDNDSNFCMDAIAIKLDPAGKLLWKKTYNEGIHFNFINSLTRATDGGYIISGASKPNKIDLPDAWFFKIDERGDTLWSKHLRVGGMDSALIANTLTDGRIYAIGRTRDNGTRPWFLWLNPDGSEIARQLGERENLSYMRISPINDGGIIAAGTNHDAESYNGKNALVIRFNDSADELWRKNLAEKNIDYIGAAASPYNNTFTVVGTLTAYSDKDQDPACPSSKSKCQYYWLMKLDDHGNVIAEKTFGTGDSEGATSQLPLKDGGLILAGTTAALSNRASIDPPNEIQIMRLDENAECKNCF